MAHGPKFRMASSRIQLCFLVSYANLYTATLCHGLNICLPEEHVALFIFGDSVLDFGNNNYINTTTDLQANFWPYGETSFEYPTGRPSDGRLIPDFISKAFTCSFSKNTLDESEKYLPLDYLMGSKHIILY